jgi:Rps23 Pro-64 3,4-dihydroxylase Tpa1-like proline 4-hydroxylase
MSSNIKLYTKDCIQVKDYYNNLLKDVSWNFEGSSGMPDEVFKHWCSNEQADNPIVKEIWSKVQTQLGDLKLTPHRTMLNLYNHGDTSYAHVDSHKWTVIVYLNPVWKLDWGGYTIFTNRGMDKIIYAAYPMPGSFVLFNGNIIHKPTAVERNAPFPRMGLTFQCEESEE